MKINKYLHSFVILFLLFTSFICPSKPLATTWAFQFVVWQGYIYVISDEYVSEIDSEIGQVTKYSDMESYAGNFSNTYKKGTKYYSIKGISTEEAIAIEETAGGYIKAYRESEYEVRSAFDGFFDGQQGSIKISVLSVFGVIAVILIYKIIKNKRVKR
ncbi:hypothetical protein ACIQAA_29420 [Neobacillus sp. NPDC093182]|uniref:hypothetical protein n=1 Tax=Neobacillus sp. NPDC093182 TaxID=3364297 RepID=UPI003808627A